MRRCIFIYLTNEHTENIMKKIITTDNPRVETLQSCKHSPLYFIC